MKRKLKQALSFLLVLSLLSGTMGNAAGAEEIYIIEDSSGSSYSEDAAADGADESSETGDRISVGEPDLIEMEIMEEDALGEISEPEDSEEIMEPENTAEENEPENEYEALELTDEDYGTDTASDLVSGDYTYRVDGNHAIITKYTGNASSVTVPSMLEGYTVTEIGEYAFYDCSGLTEVSFPDSLESIGDSAFYGCNGLTEVSFPDSLESIGDWAFKGCSGLTEVSFPDSLESIGSGAFLDCSGLTEVSFPNSLESIGSKAFEGCSGLTSVSFPDSLTSIEYLAFYRCDSIKDVVLPVNLKSVGCMVFTSPYITSITIPKNVSFMERGVGIWAGGFPGDGTVFSRCTNLEEVVFENGMTRIPDDALYDCESVRKVIIPESVKAIGDRAFSGCPATIYGVPGSYAETYAEEHNIPFKADESLGGENDFPEFRIGTDMPSIIGQDNIITGTYEASEKGKVSAELDAIVWESSDPSIAMISDHTGVSDTAGTSAELLVTLTAYRPGTVTITGTAPDGRTASVETIVEPGLQAGKMRRISGKTEVPICSVTLNEADAGYLETFISQVQIKVIHWGGLFEIADHYFELDDDFRSARIIYVLEPAADGNVSEPDTVFEITSPGGQKIEYSITTGTLETSHYGNSFTSQDVILSDYKNSWDAAYETYINAIKTEIAKYISSSDTKREATIQAKKKEMMEEDNDPGNYNKYISGTFNNDKIKNVVYEAFAAFLYDHICTSVNLSGISAEDINGTKLVNKIMNLFWSETREYTIGDVAVRIDTTGGGSAGFGKITCENHTYVVCSSISQCQEVIRTYMKELAELEISAIYQAYSAICTSALDKSLDKLTEEYLAKTLKPYVARFAPAGIGDILGDLNSCYNYYQYVKKIMNFSDKDKTPENILEAMKGIKLEDNSISSNIVKKAWKALKKATTVLTDAYGNYIAGTLDESKLVTWWNNTTSKVKAIFTCPVNVSVYNSSGELIGYTGEDDIWYTDGLIYIEEKGEAKIIYSYTDEAVSFRVSATKYGTLGCCIEEYDESGQPKGRTNYYDIPLYPGKEVTVTGVQSSSGENVRPTVVSDGKIINADEYISSEDNAVVSISCQITGNGIVSGTGSYVRGDAVVLTAAPEDGYRFTGWYQNGDLQHTSRVYEFTAKENKEVTAQFVEILDLDNSVGSNTHTAHTWDSGVVSQQPTCTQAGLRTYTCMVCGETRTEEIAATGRHTWDPGVVTQKAACMKSGIRTYACTVCKTTKTEAIPATGHSWNDGMITQKPTASQNGVRTYTCYNCGAAKTESIPVTGSLSSGLRTSNQGGLKIVVNISAKGSAALIQIGNTNKKSISVPGKVTVDGVKYTVTSVKANAFAKCKKAKKITLPSSITAIAKNSFKGAKKLKTMVLKSKNAVTIKKGAFKGLETKSMVFKVSRNMSSRQFNKIKKALKNAGFKGRVKKVN